jgi:hypothetical protein
MDGQAADERTVRQMDRLTGLGAQSRAATEILLKVKVKVDLLKLRLKLVFPHHYFQILRQTYSKSLYLENVKVRRF